MEVISEDKKNEFVFKFPEQLQEFVSKNFKFLYIENGVLFFVPPSDRKFMEDNKDHFLMQKSLIPKFKEVFNIDTAEVVKNEREVFLAKAIELFQAKKVEITLKRG